MLKKFVGLVLVSMLLGGCPSDDDSSNGDGGFDDNDPCGQFPPKVSPTEIIRKNLSLGTHNYTLTLCGIEVVRLRPMFTKNDEFSLSGPDCNSSGTRCEWVLSVALYRSNYSVATYIFFKNEDGVEMMEPVYVMFDTP